MLINVVLFTLAQGTVTGCLWPWLGPTLRDAAGIRHRVNHVRI
jgi:hypothetical protein